jgi:carbon monoxide dehydrogenase subunit G
MFNLGNLSELKIESKVGKISKDSEIAYGFLSDFNNFTQLIPPDKVKDWQATESTCSFKVQTVGEMGLEIIEKEPNNLIKMKGVEKSPYKFTVWIQLKEIEPADTRIKMTIKAELNPMVKSFAKKPLQQFADSLIDQLSTYFNS